jgi:hypothetical protein
MWHTLFILSSYESPFFGISLRPLLYMLGDDPLLPNFQCYSSLLTHLRKVTPARYDVHPVQANCKEAQQLSSTPGQLLVTVYALSNPGATTIEANACGDDCPNTMPTGCRPGVIHVK